MLHVLSLFYLHRAAKLGSADAQFNLGNLLEYGDDDGTGPPDTTTQYSIDDLVEAIKLYACQIPGKPDGVSHDCRC